MSSSLILPEIIFEDAELCRAVDARRWLAGERNTRRGPSPIQGFGSFAARRISRGRPVLVGMPRHGHFPVNHNEQPNAGRARNRAGLFALRNIEAGEEITEDYRFLPYFEQALPTLPHVIHLATPVEYRLLMARQGFDAGPFGSMDGASLRWPKHEGKVE